MAKTSQIQKWRKTPKFPVRAYNRCGRCFRPRAYIRHAGLCRICFRETGAYRRTPRRPQGQLVAARPQPRLLYTER